jgi:hypothetical protein
MGGTDLISSEQHTMTRVADDSFDNCRSLEGRYITDRWLKEDGNVLSRGKVVGVFVVCGRASAI